MYDTQQLNQFLDQYIWILILIAFWDLTWKAFGLWRAARANALGWFVAILLLNTAGILPILYLYIFNKEKPTN